MWRYPLAKAYFLKLRKKQKKREFKYKIEYWSKVTIAIFIWENVYLFCQKYKLTSRFGGMEGELFQGLNLGQKLWKLQPLELSLP